MEVFLGGVLEEKKGSEVPRLDDAARRGQRREDVGGGDVEAKTTQPGM